MKKVRSKPGKMRREAQFNPDLVATTISQLLMSDLSTLKHLHGGRDSSNVVFAEMQGRNILKKYVSPQLDPTKLETEAFEAFLYTNERIGQVNRNFVPPRDLPRNRLNREEIILLRARTLISAVLHDISTDEIFAHCRNSGGVTLGVSYSDTSNEAKFSFPISATHRASKLFDHYLTWNSSLHASLNKIQAQRPLCPRYDIKQGSRATTVEKNNTKRRMIAIEPTANMFLQQGIMSVMYKRLKRVGLDVKSLPAHHRSLARFGSISGKLATIDFESASDSVAYEVLRWLLPPKWFFYIDLVRSPTITIGDSEHTLSMVSTMGNAVTFPLETLVFWALGVASVMQRTKPNPNSQLAELTDKASVSVFGDDCILPVVDAPVFTKACSNVGFIVNKEKSFMSPEAGFRESCGGDYYHGKEVRSLYLGSPTSTSIRALEPWLYIILNAVLKKYVSYFGSLRYVYDKELLAYLFSLFRKYNLRLKVVPSDYPDDAGLVEHQDLSRLAACYDFSLSRVDRDIHGTHDFKFLKFKYFERLDRDVDLAYSLWLTKLSNQNPSPVKNVPGYRVNDDEPFLSFPVRKRGCYVVAKGSSPAMDINPIKNKG